MIRLKESLAILISIIMTNVIMTLVLENNLSKGVYLPDADSLGIPIFSGLISSGFLLILMLPTVIVPQTRKLLIWIQIVLLFIGGAFAGLNGLGWALPNHYIIVVPYLIVVMVCIWLIVSRKRKLSSIK